MKYEKTILSFLILIAFLIRILILWVYRPEFVGWFNHTYYYYVETKGLLQNGQLPFADMPMLFYIYAATSKLFTWLGIELKSAIVISSRIWMSLIPALLPIPVFQTIKNIFKDKPILKWVWFFLFACAFYPLSILHMPEFLQKNMLGLFLFSVLIWQSKLALNKLNTKRLIILISIFLLIVLTHFGTAAVTLLYLISIQIAILIHNPKKINYKLIVGLISGLGISLVFIYFLDIQRFKRIGYYIERIFDSSSLGLLFSNNDPDKFTTVFIILLPLAIMALLIKWYKSKKIKLSNNNSIFWLSNIICCYLLVLPIYEPSLMARFVNYLGLPIVFIVIYLLKYNVKKSWLKNLILGVVIIGTLTIAFGDMVSSIWHNKNKDVIYKDLVKMNEYVNFTENDLIITRNGAEHICNWFLNSKSCLITSFNTNDLKNYNRVFILNPTEGSMRLTQNSNEATKWYNYMLSNIQIPSNANEIYISDHIELFRIKSKPKDWIFDKNGAWKGYK